MFYWIRKRNDGFYGARQHTKNAQKKGKCKMPRLWLKPKGINDSIDVKTADFIMDTAVYCSAHGIVPERFDLKGRKHGPKKQ